MTLTRNKKMIVVVGPTASGKTAVAIRLAKHFDTEIISADSRQCYRELNIGVARPSSAELEEVKHHFIASHSIADEINAAAFGKYATEKSNELFEQYDILLMVGGTGLYIKAFCEGLDEIPPVKAEIRTAIISGYEKNGLGWLQEQVKLKDPDFYEKGEMKNPQRMMRALEVVESTGQSVLRFRKGEKITRSFDIIKIGLEVPREQLIQHINARVDRMIDDGLVEEVRRLQPFQKVNALQTVGYSEIFDYLSGKVSLDEAITSIKINTRQYAKRQMTWFRKDPAVKWFAPSQTGEMIEYATGQPF